MHTLKAHDGGYLAYDQNNEVLTLSNSAYLWNISISDGVASISSNAKKIFYRKSSQDFTITSFSKSNISLYKAMPDVFPTSIALSKDTLELNIGENFTFEVSYLPEDTNKRGVIWSSSDLSVVTVDNGKIRKFRQIACSFFQIENGSALRRRFPQKLCELPELCIAALCKYFHIGAFVCDGAADAAIASIFTVILPLWSQSMV